MYFYSFVIFLIVCSVFIKLYLMLSIKWCCSKVCLNGKTVIVTGSNTGIGLEAAIEFAKRGARVILACRDLKKGEQARSRIISLTENENVEVRYLNLSSLDSVREFAKGIEASEERLDILVNNAGVGFLKDKTTVDGLQILMQVNYFGHFLLTILLLDLMKKTGSGRIINVSSLMAKYAKLTVGNLNSYLGNSTWNYRNSKLANILFTRKLAQLLKGTNITTYSLHPGAIKTDIFRNIKGGGNYLILKIVLLFFKTPEEGAQTTIYTAIEQGIEKYSGEHFDECQKIDPYKTARDSNLMEGVWHETIRLLKCETDVEKLFS